MFRRSTTAAAAAATALLAGAGGAHAALPPVSKAPSTSTNPYVLPVAPGVHTRSLLTVGEKVGDYTMTGIPDGLGAFDLSGGSFGLVMNHELRDTQGVVRAHGQKGAFVSKWTIDRRTQEVTSGQDLIKPGVKYWDYTARAYTETSANPAFSRFCSSTLSDPGQFYDRRSGRGTDAQLYFANEENGDTGRVFGVDLDGRAQQLPRLGLASWENVKPADTDSTTTLTVGNEDGGSGQLWVYRGAKRRTGSDFDKAGLTNGVNSVVSVPGVATDAAFRAKYKVGDDAPFELSEVDWNQPGAAQNAEGAAEGIGLNRVEDGHWDPRPGHQNDFYFVTTEGSPRPGEPDGADGGGLWRLRFEDADHPELGGTLTLLLNGTESWGSGQAPAFKPDNMAIDRDGNLLIQEDPGNAAHVARILAYEIDSGRRGVVATFDRAQFTPARPGFITQDEESSGIIDAKRFLGRGWFLFDAQVHKAHPDPALVEMGQLLTLKVDDFDVVYGGAGKDGNDDKNKDGDKGRD
jgi:hypothetical protein